MKGLAVIILVNYMEPSAYIFLVHRNKEVAVDGAPLCIDTTPMADVVAAAALWYQADCHRCVSYLFCNFGRQTTAILTAGQLFLIQTRLLVRYQWDNAHYRLGGLLPFPRL